MRGDGRIYKRRLSSFWWVGYYGPGSRREIRESTGIRIADDPEGKKAHKILRDKRRGVLNHRDGIQVFVGPKAEKLTVRNLLESLKTYYVQKGCKSLQKSFVHWRPAMDAFGHFRALEVTTDHFRAVVEIWRQEGYAPATINRRLQMVGAAYGLAVKEGRLAKGPRVPYLSEKGNERKGFFEREQHELMLRNLPHPLDNMARFAYVCGWRLSEVRLLRWEYVDRGERVVTIPDSKNGEGRSLPLDDELWAMFERLWQGRVFGKSRLSEYVFHKADGLPVSESWFERLWGAAREAAGPTVAGRVFHDYRRTAYRNMVRAGVSETVAMTVTGWRSRAMAQRYNITSVRDISEAQKKLRAYLASGGNTESNVTEIKR